VTRVPAIRRRDLALCALLAVVFGAGPTVGDIGACSDQASALDLATFQAERKAVDCQRCRQCGLMTQWCVAACNPNAPSPVSWPTSTCFPLAHDGVVCIDALQAASCADYASYVSDTDPTVPTECDFCHLVPEAGVPVGDL
jgi:hypothetical protein